MGCLWSRSLGITCGIQSESFSRQKVPHEQRRVQGLADAGQGEVQFALFEAGRRSLSLFQRLQFDVQLVRVLANGIANDGDIDKRLATGVFKNMEERDGLRVAKALIDYRPEIDAAWQKLQYFPVDTAEKFDSFRKNLVRTSLVLDPIIYPTFPDAESKYPEMRLSHLCRSLSDTAAQLFQNIEPLIEHTRSTLKKFD
jgi:hypothetical protein